MKKVAEEDMQAPYSIHFFYGGEGVTLSRLALYLHTLGATAAQIQISYPVGCQAGVKDKVRKRKIYNYTQHKFFCFFQPVY